MQVSLGYATLRVATSIDLAKRRRTARRARGVDVFEVNTASLTGEGAREQLSYNWGHIPTSVHRLTTF